MSSPADIAQEELRCEWHCIECQFLALPTGLGPDERLHRILHQEQYEHV
jgi:hypothetical protein